jgi:hypothetical protein
VARPQAVTIGAPANHDERPAPAITAQVMRGGNGGGV